MFHYEFLQLCSNGPVVYPAGEQVQGLRQGREEDGGWQLRVIGALQLLDHYLIHS